MNAEQLITLVAQTGAIVSLEGLETVTHKSIIHRGCSYARPTKVKPKYSVTMDQDQLELFVQAIREQVEHEIWNNPR